MREIVEQVLAGDKNAFSLIVREFGVGIRAFLAAHLNDSHTIDDLAQETFIAAYGNLKTYQLDGDFGSWIKGIAHHKLLSYFRRTYREKGRLEAFQAQIVEELSEDILHATAHDSSDTIEKLRACMKRLPDRLRVAMEARYYAREKVSALAARLHTSATAISSLLYRGREEIITCMERRTSP